MSGPTLNYRSLPRPSRLRTATWIMLLVVGCVYCMTAICLGNDVFTVFYYYPREFQLEWIAQAIFASVALAVLCSGAIYLWTSVLVKRRSRRATLIALTVSLINSGLIVMFIVSAIVKNLRNPSPDSGILVIVVFSYGSVALANAIMARNLRLLLREPQFGGAR